MTRVRQGTYDALSPKARTIIDTGLEQHISERDICTLVHQETGETISRSSLNRYKNNRFLPSMRQLRERTETAHMLRSLLPNAEDGETEELYDAIEGILQLGLLSDLQSESINPGQRARILTKFVDLRLKKETLDLQRLREELNRERLELEKEKVELKRRVDQLPGAIKTWEHILSYFAEVDPAILAKLQHHSEQIGKQLEDYFRGAIN